MNYNKNNRFVLNEKHTYKLPSNNDWIYSKKINGSKIYYTDKNDKKQTRQDNKNIKKILCLNVILYGSCGYGDKCLYAHKLSEQQIDSPRESAYNILMNVGDLSHIDLQKNHSIYRSLLELTKLCDQCELRKCTGGYNCKFGACDKKYHICIKDLNNGSCNNECECVHLSLRGLKPFYINNNIVSNITTNTSRLTITPDINNNNKLDIELNDDLSTSSSDSELDDYEKSIFEK